MKKDTINEKKLICFATYPEAHFFFKKLDIVQREGVYRYRHSFCDILITGIGFYFVLQRLLPILNDYTQVYSLGIAGALDHRLPLFTPYSIASCHLEAFTKNRDTHSINLFYSNYPSIPINTHGKKLVSTLIPIHDKSIQEKWFKQGYDLVDMEGYFLAQLCHVVNKKCMLYRVVSDFCLERGEKMIQKNLEKSASILAEIISF